MVGIQLKSITLAFIALFLSVGFGTEVQVQHQGGVATVDMPATRVVALDFLFQDALVALGVTPVGYADYGDGPLPYLRAGLDTSTVVGDMFEPNLEEILALHPDLILADTARQGTIYPQLEAIAPTLLFDSYQGNYEEQLREFSLIARLVEKGALAKKILAEHRTRVEQAREAVTVRDDVTLLGVITPTEFYLYDDQSFLGSLLEKVGKPNAVRADESEGSAGHIYSISLEGLLELNPDNLVIFYNPGEEQLLDTWSSNPAFQSLEAFTSGRTYLFSRELWAKGRGVLAFNKVLGEAAASGYLTSEPAKPPYALSD